MPAEWKRPDNRSPAAQGQTVDSIINQGIPAAATGAWQCVPVSDSAFYDFGGSIYIPPTQQQEGHAELTVLWWKTARCSDGLSSDPESMLVTPSDTPEISVTGEWVAVAACANRPPEGAVAAEISLVVSNVTMSPGGKFSASFDDIYFVARTSRCANN